MFAFFSSNFGSKTTLVKKSNKTAVVPVDAKVTFVRCLDYGYYAIF